MYSIFKPTEVVLPDSLDGYGIDESATRMQLFEITVVRSGQRKMVYFGISSLVELICKDCVKFVANLGEEDFLRIAKIYSDCGVILPFSQGYNEVDECVVIEKSFFDVFNDGKRQYHPNLLVWLKDGANALQYCMRTKQRFNGHVDFGAIVKQYVIFCLGITAEEDIISALGSTEKRMIDFEKITDKLNSTLSMIATKE